MHKLCLALIMTPFMVAIAQEPSDWVDNLREHRAEPPGLLWQKDKSAPETAISPSATIEITGVSVASGLGYVWGHGKLHYGANHYAVKLSGLSAVAVGAAKMRARGEVYHLTRLQDFAGTYTAVGAAGTVGIGGAEAYLRNHHGVVIRLHSSTEGLQFGLSLAGVRIYVAGQPTVAARAPVPSGNP